MTLWLANLASYSVQLAVLVATAVVFMTALRVNTPRPDTPFLAAALRLESGITGLSVVGQF